MSQPRRRLSHSWPAIRYTPVSCSCRLLIGAFGSACSISPQVSASVVICIAIIILSRIRLPSVAQASALISATWHRLGLVGRLIALEGDQILQLARQDGAVPRVLNVNLRRTERYRADNAKWPASPGTHAGLGAARAARRSRRGERPSSDSANGRCPGGSSTRHRPARIRASRSGSQLPQPGPRPDLDYKHRLGR
jgi:hypothetical protein